MELKIFFTVFATVFLAELGDKTQLATLLFAADKHVSKLTIFLGAAMALVLATGLGVAMGGLVSQYVSEKFVALAAGGAFIAIGIWMLVKA
jgi:putative Ca2+/H+ antiporter (TMEM165/GDT1 family)